jgi:hypothetical protein
MELAAPWVEIDARERGKRDFTRGDSNADPPYLLFRVVIGVIVIIQHPALRTTCREAFSPFSIFVHNRSLLSQLSL